MKKVSLILPTDMCTYVSGIQKYPKANTPYPIPENIPNNDAEPMFASRVGTNLLAKKNDILATAVAKPEPMSLALEGSNSPLNIHIHDRYPAPSPKNKHSIRYEVLRIKNNTLL